MKPVNSWARAIRALVGKFQCFWFPPCEPFDLGLCRFLFYGAMFLRRGTTSFYLEFGRLPESMWLPVPLYSFFELPPFGSSELFALHSVWRVSLLLSALGIWTSVSTVVCGLTSLFLIGYVQSFGYYPHTDLPFVLISLILMFSRSGDAFSVDALLPWRRKRPCKPTGDYAWPLRLAQFVFCMVFFSAGLSKLRASGLEWVTGDTLLNYFVRNSVYYEDVAVPLQRQLSFVLRHEYVARVLAASAVLIELGAPLALFSRRLRLPIIAAIALMQLSFFLVLRQNFLNFAGLYFFWFPWAEISGFLRNALRRVKHTLVTER